MSSCCRRRRCMMLWCCIGDHISGKMVLCVNQITTKFNEPCREPMLNTLNYFDPVYNATPIILLCQHRNSSKQPESAQLSQHSIPVCVLQQMLQTLNIYKLIFFSFLPGPHQLCIFSSILKSGATGFKKKGGSHNPLRLSRQRRLGSTYARVGNVGSRDHCAVL